MLVPSGLPPGRPATTPKPGSCSLEVTPTSGCYPPRRPSACPCGSRNKFRIRGNTTTTLMEFLAPPTLEHQRVHLTGLPSRMCRPQGFSPSRRVAPRRHLRPYFMPKTPMGFCSSGVFPRRQAHRAHRSRVALLVFSPLIAASEDAARGVLTSAMDTREHLLATFRALLRRRVRTTTKLVKVWRGPIPS